MIPISIFFWVDLFPSLRCVIFGLILAYSRFSARICAKRLLIWTKIFFLVLRFYFEDNTLYRTKFRRTKLLKIGLAVENLSTEKLCPLKFITCQINIKLMLFLSNIWGNKKPMKNCRNFELVPKILRPPKFSPKKCPLLTFCSFFLLHHPPSEHSSRPAPLFGPVPIPLVDFIWGMNSSLSTWVTAV